jgi:hypothetical protein
MIAHPMKSILPAVTLLLPATPLAAKPATGPLRVSKINSLPVNGKSKRSEGQGHRYFTDGTGKPIYLTGSHTWPNLIDRGPTDPPPKLDYNRYLDFLAAHHHNFIRLWGRHVTWYRFYSPRGQLLYGAPLAWPRTGPGVALDGKPRFDLSKFDPAYFARLRERAVAAGKRGIYVGIMLFGGYSECTEWQGNPFNSNNNINGVNGDPDGDGSGFETQNLDLIPPAVLELQKAYVRKVIDTVNHLDNVLYEISNESRGDSSKWQYHLIDTIHTYEKGKRKQHPVGMTAFRDINDNPALFASPADWISPGPASPFFDDRREPYVTDPPEADGRKVILLGSDHLYFRVILDDPTLGRAWAWKSFCRGHNPILMENLFADSTGEAVPVTTGDPGYSAARKAMGDTARFAARINLAAMTPRSDLSSTGYCLAREGSDYVVFQPDSGAFDLTLPAGTYRVEWFDPATGVTPAGAPITVEPGKQRMTPPFTGQAVLYLKARQ